MEVKRMNALSDTFDGLDLGSSGNDRRHGWSLLKRFVERIAAEDRAALRRFPEGEELRLSLYALGRGFDSM
jgi:hypothetical protein